MSVVRKNTFNRKKLMFILFFIVWIILNGQITLEIVLFGLGISAVMFIFVCKFCGYSIKREKMGFRLALASTKYILVLIWEIIKANIAVIGLIMSSRNEIEPAVVSFSTDLKTDSARVLLANSITLTPGTITASLEEGVFTVHCLDKSLANGIDNSVFVDMLRKMEAIGEEGKC